jgi:uncharacterized caspase-like protein
MKKALLIGINYYNTTAKLNGCIDDVVNMRHLLIDSFGFSLDKMTTLRDDTTNTSLLPTKSNILKALRQLVADSAGCTEIWIHYSGHGSRVPDANKDELSGLDNVIVPVDYRTAGFIVDDDLYTILKGVKCKTVLLFDSCHSGTVVDLPWSFIYQNPGSYRIQQNNKNVLTNNNIFMFSGCRDDQTSADIYSADQQQAVGAFTNAFISCIRARNHEVSFLTLYRDICMFLAANRYTQVPVFSSSTPTPTFFLSRKAAIMNSAIIPLTPSLSSVFANTSSIKLKMIL